MAALLGPLLLLLEDVSEPAEVCCDAGAVTTTVCPPIVTTDGDADLVAEAFGLLLADEDGDDEPDDCALGTFEDVPVR